jgi:hypothetical protein
MNSKLSVSQAEHWSGVAKKLQQVSALIEECRLDLLLKLNITEGRPLEAIDRIADAVNGQSYMFTPQTEWTGGDSSDPKNFKVNLPHIAKGLKCQCKN